MTIDQLRERLLQAMQKANAVHGAWAVPNGLEEAIQALPDTTLVDQLPDELSAFIHKELSRCLRHERLINLVSLLEPSIPTMIKRIQELQLSPSEVVIGVLSADDEFGRYLAYKAFGNEKEAEWAENRSQGKIPITICLLSRACVQFELENSGKEIATMLALTQQGIAVVVAAHEAVGVFCITHPLKPAQA